MKRRIVFTSVFIVLIVNLTMGILIYRETARAAVPDDPYRNYELFASVVERIRSDYIDGRDLTYHELIESALRGMLSSLDPHSEFMVPRQYEELQKDTQGAFGGVGIVVTMQEDPETAKPTLTVVFPMSDTPALRAGVAPGDRIVKIEGRTTENLSLEDAVQRLRGKPGTEVNMTFFRPSTGGSLDVVLERAIIKLDTVKDLSGGQEFKLAEDKLGYIWLSQFGEQTSGDLRTALETLMAQGMKGLVLDLRDNPGGLLDEAVSVCSQFLPEDQLVVFTQGQASHHRVELRAHGDSPLLDLPLVILVNRGSASASEIVSGCLQDLKRAVILGEQTFGKGSVQSIFPISGGAALRLTTAKYYTPSEKVIHGRGVTPDIRVPLADASLEALYYQRAPGGIDAQTHLSDEDRERYRKVQDEQLNRAKDLLKGILTLSERTPSPRP